jgi:pilus assembly protein CpaF
MTRFYSISERLGLTPDPTDSTETAGDAPGSAPPNPTPAGETPVAAPPVLRLLADPAPPATGESGGPSPVLGGRLGASPASVPVLGGASALLGAVALDRSRLSQMRAEVQRRLVQTLGPTADAAIHPERMRGYVEATLDQVLAEQDTTLTRADRSRVFQSVVAELLGFGPIEPLLHDDTVTEIMVNGPEHVWVERRGVLEQSDVKFDDDAHVRRVIERIVSPLGRRIDESSPMVDARLPDGSRVNAIIPPLSLIGPVVTIRKFARRALTVKDLIEYGSFTTEVAEFLSGCVRGRINVIISGGTGSGKTTTLNVLSIFIPENERILTIEDAAELQLAQSHVIPLEARPANAEGAGSVPIRQLLVNALRMRPDRIIVGECRGAEALDMLQAMNTGHDGSMTTLHANGPRDALSRIETMVLLAGTDLPHRAIREQIASAVELIVHQERLKDGTRRVTEVVEVQGIQGDTIVLEPLFRFVHRGFDGKRIIGKLEPVGPRPRLISKLEEHGITLPARIFGSGAGAVA